MFKAIKIILVSLLILFVAWLTPVVLKNPGFIQIELIGYQIEMSLLVAIGIGVVVFLTIWFVYALYKTPKKAIKHISANQSRKKFALGLLALSEGKWPVAEKLLVKSANKSPTPELSFMAAARAAVAQNKLEKAEEYLDQAEASTDNPLTVDLTRCEIWIKTNQAQKAIPLLQNILKTYPNNPRAVHLLTQASQQTQDWKQLRDILPKAKKLAIISAEQNKLLSHKSLTEEINLANNADQLMATWNSIDKKIKPGYINAFCENGLRIAAFQQVTDVIEKQQKTSFSDQLTVYWSRLPHNLNHRIKLAEKWLSGHPNNSKLLSCLGQLFIEKKQWPDAEKYLLKAHETEPDKQVNQLLGRVYQELNQPEKALMHYQQSNSKTAIMKTHV